MSEPMQELPPDYYDDDDDGGNFFKLKTYLKYISFFRGF